MKYEIEAIKDYIQVKSPWEIKSDIFIFRGFTLIFGPLLLLPCERHPVFQAIVIINTLIIVLWGWIEARDIEKHQKTHWLYFGVSSFLLSVLFLLGAIGMFEHMRKAPPNAVLWIGAGYLSVLIFGGYLHIYTLKKGYLTAGHQEKTRRKHFWLWRLMPVLPGLIVLFSQVMLMTFGTAYEKSRAYAFPLGSYLFLMGTVGIHKYYLLKKYEQYVRVFHLTKKNDPATVKWTTPELK